MNMQSPSRPPFLVAFWVCVSGCSSIWLDPIGADYATVSTGTSGGEPKTSTVAPMSGPDDLTTTATTSESGSSSSSSSASSTSITDGSSGGTQGGSPPLCGNGELDQGEACDDGNLINQDDCTNACVPQSCGDRFLGLSEECDDGNHVDGDGCSGACDCEILTCGDGVPGLGEECDDGNAIPSDGCSSCCQRETLHVFVSSQTFPITFGGSFDADVRCMIAAENAGLMGDSANHFAWLGIDGFPMWGYVGVVPRPYVLLDGTVVAHSSEELFSGNILAPINVTEFGDKLLDASDPCANSSLRVWTGLSADGTAIAERTCDDWSSASGMGRFGSASAKDERWTDCGSDMPCDAPAHLYCFELFMLDG